MKKLLISTFFLFVFFATVFSQTSEIDQLKKDIENSEDDEFFRLSNKLAELYLERDAKVSLELVETLQKKGDIKDFPIQRATSIYLEARARSILGDYDQANSLFDRNIIFFEQQKIYPLQAKSLIGKAMSHIKEEKFEEAKSVLLKSIEILEPLETTNELGNAYRELGRTEGYLKNHEAEKKYLEKAISIHKELKNTKELSEDFFRIGIYHYDQYHEEETLKYYSQSKQLKEKINDLAGLARVNNSLGVLHSEKGNYETSIDYYKQSIDAFQKIGDQQALGIVLNNLGVAYVDWGKLDSAYVYHKRTLDLNKAIHYSRGEILSYANIGEVHQFKGEYNTAIQYYLMAKNLSTKTVRQPLMRLIYYKLGEIYLANNSLDSAEYYLKQSESIRKRFTDADGLRNTYENLSELYEKRKDYPKALAYHKLFKEAQDSITKREANQKLAEIQARFDTERQEKEIAQLQQENERKTLWQNILGISTFLAIVLGVLIFRFFRFRNKKNKELLELKEAQRLQLEELDKAKNHFFNNISHEFRTPLTLILGPLSDLKESVSKSKQSAVDTIERNSQRLLKLINQLLDLSKLEAGHLRLKTSYVNIIPYTNVWVQSFQSMADLNKIKLDFKTDHDACFVYVDLEKLEEIMVNLLSNAFKYTPQGGTISVHVSTAKRDNQVCIIVEDSGKGIAPQELERIFDRFYQASNANSENVIGTGIGLSLAKELAELHKGDIKVESTLGQGSIFKVFLPLGKDHLSKNEIAISAPDIEKIEPVDEPSQEVVEEVALDNDELPHVLVIEDNEDLRHYIKSIIQHNFQVHLATDGAEGIEKAMELVPDIVISDVMMPKKDGFEVCQTLKNNLKTSHIPIILLTARSTKEDKLQGYKHLADAYLTKPFDKDELLAKLNSLMELRKRIQEHFGVGELLTPDKVSLTSMDVQFMEKLKELISNEIDNHDFSVEQLAERVFLSRSQLFRKVKAITNLTPNEYIRNFRLHRAMDMLQQQSATVAEVAYEVGFQTPSYFSKCFQEQFGISPRAVSKK